MKAALALLVIVVLLLHQDIWLWTNRSLVFGFLPVGLAYHAGFSILAAVTMAVLVRFLWPADLDEDTGEGGPQMSAALPGGREAGSR